MKTRGQLLTETFKRMDSLGITEAEDIIYQLAKELDELSQAEPALKEAPPILEAGGYFELTKEMQDRVYSIEYYADGTVTLYLANDSDTTISCAGNKAEVSPHPDPGT